MDLSLYLERIGLSAIPPSTSAGLEMVHRAQGAAIPYEGLDIPLGVPLDLDLSRIFDKLVIRRRGGWCYETNGLLGWALAELGFDVQRCTAGVYRREKGDAALGTHMMLLVHLEEAWLCDLGLGDGLRAPVPLVEGPHRDGALTFHLERLPDGYWRFTNHPEGSPDSFDFHPGPADEALFLRQNAFLQSDPESSFVLRPIAIRMTGEGSLTLVGRVLRRLGADGLHKSLIGSPEEMVEILARDFGITGVDCAAMWPRILSRHAQVFGHESAAP